jgi:hypothetical protein
MRCLGAIPQVRRGIVTVSTRDILCLHGSHRRWLPGSQLTAGYKRPAIHSPPAQLPLVSHEREARSRSWL